MTTVTTVFGLLPLIISFDPLFFSMAVILAFGLVQISLPISSSARQPVSTRLKLQINVDA